MSWIADLFGSNKMGEDDSLIENDDTGGSGGGMWSVLLDKAFTIFGDDINAVIENGMMFSCFNSTFTPSGSANDIENKFKPWIVESADKLKNASSSEDVERYLNEMTKKAYLMGVYHHVLNNANWKSCSQKAISEVLIPFSVVCRKMVTESIEALKVNYDVSILRTDTVASLLEIPEYGVREWGKSTDKVNIPVYSVRVKAVKVLSTLTGGTSNLGGSLLMGAVLLGGVFTMFKKSSTKNNNYKSKIKFKKWKR